MSFLPGVPLPSLTHTGQHARPELCPVLCTSPEAPRHLVHTVTPLIWPQVTVDKALNVAHKVVMLENSKTFFSLIYHLHS